MLRFILCFAWIYPSTLLADSGDVYICDTDAVISVGEDFYDGPSSNAKISEYKKYHFLLNWNSDDTISFSSEFPLADYEGTNDPYKVEHQFPGMSGTMITFGNSTHAFRGFFQEIGSPDKPYLLRYIRMPLHQTTILHASCMRK